MSEVAIKHDGEKPRCDLIPPRAALEIAEVMTLGAKKYSDWNFLKGNGIDPERLIAAAMRHIFAHTSGIALDQETGLSHLAHAASSIMMAIEVVNHRKEIEEKEIEETEEYLNKDIEEYENV